MGGDFDGRRLDRKLMIASVFFDRKIANEDNPALEKLELYRTADMSGDKGE